MTISRSSKIAAATFCITIAIVIQFLPQHLLGPWDFGFLISPDSTVQTLTGSYALEIHSLSSVVIWTYEVLESIFGLKWEFLAIPGAIIIGFLVFAYLPSVSFIYRIGATFVIIGGPLKVMSYTWTFRRDAFDIIFIGLFLLLVLIMRRRRPVLVPLVAAAFSLLLWKTHYTIWPFFFMLTIVYLYINRLTTGAHRGRFSIIAALLLVFPLAFEIRPLQVYISSLVSLRYIDLSQPLSLIGGFGHANINSVSHVIYNRPNPVPWMPEAAYAAYASVLIAMGIHYIYYIDDYSVTRPRQQLFVSGSVAFLVITPLFVVRGYTTRVIVLWPIVTMLFFGEYLTVVSSDLRGVTIDITEGTASVVFSALLILSLIHISPLVISDYPTQSEFSVDTQQLASGEFATYMPPNSPVYTDLNHASGIYLKSNHRLIRTGAVAAGDGNRVLLDWQVAKLFDPSRVKEGYVLSRTNSQYGTVEWGGVIPPVNRGEYIKSNLIYSNGKDIISFSETSP